MQVKLKTSLEHLPTSKQEAIRAIAALIQAEVVTELVILFGSYARGGWVEDEETGYRSDYDLLIIVATEAEVVESAQWTDLWARARAIAGAIPVSPIVHDLKQVNREIRAGQYFFIDILREGVLLHDSRRFQLAVPKLLGPKERLEHAKYNFRYWFNSASDFWRGAGYYAERGRDAHAAFLLHQTAERYFHTALLVFTDYKPKTHDLADLAGQSALLHPALAGALPREEGEDKRLFRLLKKAYIEARYSKSYHVTEEELVELRARTLDLGKRVREACIEQMGTFCGPELVGELPEVPAADEEREMPEAPSLDDPKAFEAWRDRRDAMSYERGELYGEQRGRREGRVEGRVEGRREGIAEGLARGQAEALLAIFEARGLPVDATTRATVEACTDPVMLKRWVFRAMVASSASEALSAEA